MWSRTMIIFSILLSLMACEKVAVNEEF